MALQGGHGSLIYAVSVPVTSETCWQEAPACQQPAAGCFSDAARQEDPAERGVYRSNQLTPPAWGDKRATHTFTSITG